MAGKKRRVDSLAKALADLDLSELEKLDHCVQVLQEVIRKI
jgi:hypothetical protein